MPHPTRFMMFVLSILLAACATPSASPVVFPSSTAEGSQRAPASPIVTLPTATPAASPTAPPSATRVPAVRAATATRTAAARTATPAAPKITWEVRTLLVGPGQPGRLYTLLVNRYDATTPQQMRLVFSDNQGASWSPFPGGLPADPPCLHNVNLDYATPGALYASICKGPYRGSANRWNLVSSQETWMVAIVYKQPNIIRAISTREKGGVVIRGADGGATWNEADWDLVNFTGVANIGIDPRDTNALYAIITPKYAGSYLRRGDANGRWKTMHTPLNDNVIDTGMTIDGATGALYVTTADYTVSKNGNWQVWRTRNPSALDIDAVT